MIRAHAVSDIGRVRKTNEDWYVCDLDLQLFAIADGMGGHRAGEVASHLAIEALTSFVQRSAGDTDFTWPYGIDQTLSFDGNRLRTAIHLANRRVYRAAESSDDYNGMGTTIVSLLVNGPQIAVGYVGDSRLYLLSDGGLHQLTSDDSWGTILARDASLSPSDIAQHPMRHVLTNVLGARECVDVHVTERGIDDCDVLLLCTDGLHGALPPDSVRDILTRIPDVEEAAQTLVDAALSAGGRDNVTAVVVRSEPDRPRSGRPRGAADNSQGSGR